jgi:hypothetical protein
MTMSRITGLGYLGLTAKGPRAIGSGAEYEKYFDVKLVDNKETTLKDGDVYNTLDLMHKIIEKYGVGQTRKIAARLKGSTRVETCRNIWNFLYHNIQYTKDASDREQLRQPLRSWRDRKTGVDCDCFSIFAGSILTNLKIPFAFRMAAYGGDFQHVYVVVPASGTKISGDRSGYIVIDPVIDAFDKEQPFKKKDDSMKITMLSGPGECPVPVTAFTVRRYMPTQAIWDFGFIPTHDFLAGNNIAYRHVLDKNTNGGMFVIKTACGEKSIPPVLTQDQAAQVKQQALTPDQAAAVVLTTAIAPGEPAPGGGVATTVAKMNEAARKVPWGWLIAGAIGGAVIFGGKRKSKTD